MANRGPGVQGRRFGGVDRDPYEAQQARYKRERERRPDGFPIANLHTAAEYRER